MGVSVFAYVIRQEQRHVLSSEPWDRVRFVAEHLARYVTAAEA